ncbi:MAG: serine/threonine-protein kinase [Patescibacteria group bacterium]|nr:serine/threonine-protein kinase [Patescibacteria group bacterium]
MINENVIDKKGIGYVIQEEIGRGGFGTVYLAKTKEGLPYAIKFMGPIDNKAALLSFEREVALATAIQHQNILGFVGQGEHIYRGAAYFFTVTEYCPDGNYRGTLNTGGAPLDSMINDFQQILLGLDALHQKLVHRDIKPENILKVKGDLKIGDLGLSKSIDEATQTMTFKGSGTPLYMAPEVWERGKITPATDLYACGVMLFEACTGKAPFASDDSSELRRLHLYQSAPRAKNINPNVPDHIDGLIRRLLEKDQTKRYQSAKDVIAVLTAGQATSPNNLFSGLKNRIRQSYDEQESKRLEFEKTANDAQEAQERIRYMEKQLLSQFDDVVQEINEGIQETKIHRSDDGNSARYSLGRRALCIDFFRPGEIYNNKTLPSVLKERGVTQGGVILIQDDGQNRQGWNVVLTRSEECQYGTWLLIESDISPLTGKALSYPPAATDSKLLSENLAYHWMKTMHTWLLKDKPLEQADIVRILSALIP